MTFVNGIKSSPVKNYLRVVINFLLNYLCQSYGLACLQQ